MTQTRDVVGQLSQRLNHSFLCFQQIIMIRLVRLLRRFRTKQDATDSYDLSGPPEKENDEHSRGEWGSQAEFILALLGYSVGLGNVWR